MRGAVLELDDDLMTRDNIERAIALARDGKVEEFGEDMVLQIQWSDDIVEIIANEDRDYIFLGMAMSIVFNEEDQEDSEINS